MADMKKYLDTTALGTLVDQIKAEDAKVLAAAKKHANDLATNYDAAGSAATAESNAKTYADQKVQALSDGQVKANKEAIEKLNGADTVEGSVAKAVKDAKDALQANLDVVDGKADKNAEDIAAINNETTGILAKAKAYADEKDAEVIESVEELEAYVGEFTSENAKTVVEYIDEKTSGIASDATVNALGERVTQAEKDIDAIEADYLKAADKTALQGNIDTLTQTHATDKAALEASIKAIADDYLKAEDKTALQNQITANANAIELLTEGVDTEKVDGVKDLIAYVEEHGTEVTGIKEDIAANAKAISDEVTRSTAKDEELAAAVETKAEAQALTDAITALSGVDAGQEERIAALEGRFTGEDSVEDMIGDAKEAAIAAAAEDATTKANQALADAKAYADEEDAKIESRVDALETASATHALASDLTALDNRVTTAEGEIDTLQSEMDAVEALAAANKAAHEANAAAIAKKASQEDLEKAVARIAKNESDIASLNTAVSTKAEQEDLDDAVEKIAKNEEDIAANTSAINSFTAITSDEVNALFA